MRIQKFFLVAAASFALVGVSACGSNSTSTVATDPVGQITLTPASTVIDVRSAEEFAAGHISGAINLNVENGDLEKAFSTLDKSANYSIYCQSGRRSALAVAAMEKAGFTEVEDLAGINEAAKALALPIVPE